MLCIFIIIILQVTSTVYLLIIARLLFASLFFSSKYICSAEINVQIWVNEDEKKKNRKSEWELRTK